MKRSRAIPKVVLVTTLAVAGCEGEQPRHRDAYASVDACMADWGTKELCNPASDEEKRAMHGSAPHTGGGIFIWGPWYAPGNRSVVHHGVTRTPMISRAISAPARSGFGATGRSVSVSSGG